MGHTIDYNGTTYYPHIMIDAISESALRDALDWDITEEEFFDTLDEIVGRMEHGYACRSHRYISHGCGMNVRNVRIEYVFIMLGGRIYWDFGQRVPRFGMTANSYFKDGFHLHPIDFRSFVDIVARDVARYAYCGNFYDGPCEINEWEMDSKCAMELMMKGYSVKHERYYAELCYDDGIFQDHWPDKDEEGVWYEFEKKNYSDGEEVFSRPYWEPTEDTILGTNYRRPYSVYKRSEYKIDESVPKYLPYDSSGTPTPLAH